MATRKRTDIVLPWESRSAWLRELVYEGRVRYVPLFLIGLFLLGWAILSAVRRNDIESTRRRIDDVHRALDAFRLDYGRCPTTMRELVHPPRTGNRYLDEEPLDAWGHAM